MLDYLRMVRSSLVGQLSVMNEAGDARGAGYIAGQLTKTLETMARITGEIGDLARSTINITNNNVSVLTEPHFRARAGKHPARPGAAS